MKISKIVPIILGLSLIACSVVLIDALEPEQSQPPTKAALKQPVTVIQTIPKAHRPTITLLGTTQARWPVEMKAPTTAKLLWLAEKSEPGTLVKRGDILATLDTTHLKSQLAQAHSAVKQAELNLQREQHEQTVALKMLSPERSSAYARHEPQIASARAELIQARENYTSARQYLNDATVSAPFDAVILRRGISPGQRLENGDVMFELAASDSLDIRLPVPEFQWPVISTGLDNTLIQVTDRQGQQWSASIRHISPLADRDSRQRQLVLAVNQPYQKNPGLLPNQQVTVDITLAIHNAVSEVPLSSLTRDGQVWTVDENDQLRRETVTLLEENQHYAYIVFEENPDRARTVVTYPLLSMLPGTEVSPEGAEFTLANKEIIR